MQSPPKYQSNSSELDRTICKFMWNNKKPRIAKTILKNKTTSGGITIHELKQYYRAIVIKTAWYSYRERQIDKWNRIGLVFWWGLHWICRLLLVKMVIFTILILPIHAHGRSFHLLRSSITFFRGLKFSSYWSFTCLVRVTPRYFMLFGIIMKVVVSLISFSSCFSFV